MCRWRCIPWGWCCTGVRITCYLKTRYFITVCLSQSVHQLINQTIDQFIYLSWLSPFLALYVSSTKIINLNLLFWLVYFLSFVPLFVNHSLPVGVLLPQPVQLSSELDRLLLSMCEDVVLKRADLLAVLETCEQHHTASLLPPPDRLIKQLVEDVFRNSVSWATQVIIHCSLLFQAIVQWVN